MKKFVSAVIAAAVLTAAYAPSIAVVPAYAAQEQAQAMTDVILKVKNKITIPEELSKFSQDSFIEDDKSTWYNFDWSSPDKEIYDSISVTADGKGDISRYYRYIDRKNDGKLLSISKEDAQAAALAFIQKAAPERFSDETDSLVLDETATRASLGDGYVFYFNRMKNDIPVQNNNASVTVKVNNGQAVITNMTITWDSNYSFAAAGTILEEADAKAKYIANAPLKLHYRSAYDREKTVLFEYFYPEGTQYIDATTGEILKAQSKYQPMPMSGGGGGMAKNEAARDTGLTPSELESVTDVEGLLSTADAEAKVRAIPELNLTDDMKLVSNSVTKNETNYYVNLRFSNQKEDEKINSSTKTLAVSVDGKTGDLFSVNGYGTYRDAAADKKAVELTESQIAEANDKIAEFIYNYCGARASAVTFEQSSNYDTTVNNHFVRVVNGLPLDGNGIQVAWDTATNTVSSMTTNWQNFPENLPAADSAISDSTANSKVLEAYPLHLVYVLSGDQYRLAYTLSTDSAVYLNAASGELTDYAGRPASNASFGAYTDLDDHWVKVRVETLADYGIRLPGQAFYPDNEISQADYLRLIACAEYGSYAAEYDQDTLYRMLSSIIDKGQIDPESPVTKEEAVMYLMRIAGYQEVAELPDIFKCDFTDADQISPDKIGYCALAKGFGVVNGSDDGSFQPQKITTRAEAASMIFNYLAR